MMEAKETAVQTFLRVLAWMERYEAAENEEDGYDGPEPWELWEEEVDRMARRYTQTVTTIEFTTDEGHRVRVQLTKAKGGQRDVQDVAKVYYRESGTETWVELLDEEHQGPPFYGVNRLLVKYADMFGLDE